MTLARAAGPEEQRVFALADEAAGGQIEDQTAIHLRIEGEVEVVERSVGVAKAGLLAAAFQQAVAAPRQFIATRHEIRSIGAMGSACAWRKRVSSTAAMPPSRSCRKRVVVQ
jgi:hypothetical protein